MLQDFSLKTAQNDIHSVGRIIIECLEPSTFLENGDSLISDGWDPVLIRFLESTKSCSIQELLRVSNTNHYSKPQLNRSARLPSTLSRTVLP